MTNKSFKATLFCATALVGFAQAPAFAQTEPDGAASTDANEIIVTATRRSTTLQDAPINISAVGQQQLARQRIDSVQDLAALRPV